jgi:hypothetical protein
MRQLLEHRVSIQVARIQQKIALYSPLPVEQYLAIAHSVSVVGGWWSAKYMINKNAEWYWSWK